MPQLQFICMRIEGEGGGGIVVKKKNNRDIKKQIVPGHRLQVPNCIGATSVVKTRGSSLMVVHRDRDHGLLALTNTTSAIQWNPNLYCSQP